MRPEEKIKNLEEELNEAKETIKHMQKSITEFIEKSIKKENEANEVIDKLSHSLHEQLQEVKFLRAVLKKIVDVD